MSSSIANVDHMVEEFLLYRGFTQTFRCLENEKSKDRAKSFQENKIVDQVFQYLVNFEMESFISLWDFLCKRFFLHLDQEHLDMISGLKTDLLKYYLVHAVRTNNKEKCHQFFASYSHEILSESGSSASLGAATGGLADHSQLRQAQAEVLSPPLSLRHWYVLPYLQEPEKDPQFCVFFTQKWTDSLRLALNNFLSVVLSNAPPPKLILLDRWYKSDVQHAMRRQLRTVTEEAAQLRARCEGYEKRLVALHKLTIAVSAHLIKPRGGTGGTGTRQLPIPDFDEKVANVQKLVAAVADSHKAQSPAAEAVPSATADAFRTAKQAANAAASADVRRMGRAAAPPQVPIDETEKKLIGLLQSLLE